ncbi:MAG: biotin/lipoyl-binding protein, partial [Alphaproteobacteria bacterium]|nr:biotin/lipoyl-binding protein [Alphaproteobacteria bacterium]
MAPKDVEAVSEPAQTGSDAGAEARATEKAVTRQKNRRWVGVGLVALVGPLAALALGGYIYLSGGRYIATDNAYVKSDKIAVSADVTGRVVEVVVRENQMVSPGDMLFRIDPAPFKIALDRAEARLMAARGAVAALRAVYKQKQAGLERRRADIAYHQQLYDRQKSLSRRNLVTGFNYETATRNLRDAEDQVKVAEQELAEALAKLGDPGIAVDEHPGVLEAKATR